MLQYLSLTKVDLTGLIQMELPWIYTVWQMSYFATIVKSEQKQYFL